VPERFVVQVDADQFDRLARPTLPVAGVAELIWNALDAEAEAVSVSIGRTELDAVDVVTVTDSGHGMSHDDALRDFKRLGGSWKKLRAESKNGKRTLHGKEGAGRFRAFAIGSTVEWSSVARRVGGALERTRITGSMDSSEFAVSGPEALATGTPGTEVQITRPRQHANKLLGDDAVPWLVTRFAVYLVKYPGITVTYEGTALDPATIVAREKDVELDAQLGGAHGAPALHIMEWKADAKAITPSLVLCDENGVALHEITGNIEHPPDLPYTAYLTWPGFAEHAADLELADLGHAILTPIVQAARQAIHGYLDDRLSERRTELIDRWKAEKVYPYSGEATSVAEAQERKVFDVVAVAAAPAVAKEAKAAKLSLRLIKEALAQPPGALHRVLTEVLELTPEQLADFDELLERTSLTSVIYASKLVTDRLDFLHVLEGMLFDHDKRKRLLERQQLHRILANGRTWVFGEQFALAVDDQGLTKVLEAHRAALGDTTPVDHPVTDSDGHTRVVDLMLSRASHFADRRQHLVVELKRPSAKLTQTELAQIANYAVAVSRDDRFKSPDVTWEFWLLGDAMDEVVEELVNRKDAPPGLYTEGTSYRIWVRRWADVLEENRQRLHFYRDHLNYVAPEEETELNAVVRKYLMPAPEPSAHATSGHDTAAA
jgi:Histidine kinase-, DNA gyrase B-, and HSP90-like ATPase